MTLLRFFSLLLASWTTIFTISCNGNQQVSVHKAGRFLMGTLAEVTVAGPRDKAMAAAQACLDEIRRVEDLASFHKSSELTRINDMAGIAPVRVDPELLELAQTSLRFAEHTDGAFDPTIGAVTRLWHFSGVQQPRVPEKKEVSDALSRVDWRLVQIDYRAGTIFLPERGMELDFGGLAKGYALDRVNRLLKTMGVDAALVNIGGDILAVGEKSPGRPWRVGVRDPRNATEIRAVVSVTDKILLTSGDYERFLDVDGRRYHHILDPKTGYPPTELQSVTLLVPTGLTASSAAVFVMGVEKGMKYIDSIAGVTGMLIDSRGNVHLSSHAASSFEIQ